MRTADVVVVGGGIIGSAVAWALAREQRSVVLLERDAVGAHASSVAAGMLAPFSEGEGEARGVPLGRRALDELPAVVAELRERSGIDPVHVRSGLLRLATDASDAEGLRSRAAAFAEHGVEWIDADAVRAREPFVHESAAGAVWSPLEGHVRSDLLTRAFAHAARSLGAEIESGTPAVDLQRDGTRVTGVRTPRGTVSAGHVVLATGPWAGDGRGSLGLPQMAVRPVRGQLVLLDTARPLFGAVLWGAGIYLVPRPDGRVVVGATEEEVGFDCRVTAGGVRGLLEAAPRLVPALAEAGFADARAGLRPVTPDGLPLIGPAPGFENLILALGHGRNGVLLSATTGGLVADLVAGKALPEEARSYRTDRFAAPGDLS